VVVFTVSHGARLLGSRPDRSAAPLSGRWKGAPPSAGADPRVAPDRVISIIRPEKADVRPLRHQSLTAAHRRKFARAVIVGLVRWPGTRIASVSCRDRQVSRYWGARRGWRTAGRSAPRWTGCWTRSAGVRAGR
jgi:hypothetical protein